MAKRDIFITALQQAGRRITEQRRVICDYLAEYNGHPTPYQIYADLSRHHPEISRATVYNTLNVLRELGAIVEIGSGAGHTHYETDTTPHLNLICLRCHRIIDHHAPTFDELQRKITAVEDFTPVAVQIDVMGFCEECRARKKAEIREQWLAQRQDQSRQAQARETDE